MKSSNKRKIYHTNGITAMRIEGEMNIYRAGELKKLLHPTLSHKGVLEVDLSVVTELDTAGLQLLVLAKKSAQARDGSLRLTARSPAVNEVLELLGLGEYFDNPLTAQACEETSADHPQSLHSSGGTQ